MKRKKWEIILDWTLVILTVLVVVIVRAIPTVRKLAGLDKDGVIFALFFSAVLLAVIFISKTLEKSRMRAKAEELADNELTDDVLERRKEEFLEKHGYDKKIGKTIIEDLTKRYRRKAVFPAILTALLMFFGVDAFFMRDYSRAALFLLCAIASLVYVASAAYPVKTFKERFDITSRLPLSEEDYLNGKLVCKGTSGINIGSRLFVVCFTPRYVRLFPIMYIEKATRCMVYKTEKHRGFLGSKKVEYKLLLNVRQPSTKRGEAYDLEFFIPFDRLRLEIAFDALKDKNVPYEYGYKYIEKK